MLTFSISNVHFKSLQSHSFFFYIIYSFDHNIFHILHIISILKLLQVTRYLYFLYLILLVRIIYTFIRNISTSDILID